MRPKQIAIAQMHFQWRYCIQLILIALIKSSNNSSNAWTTLRIKRNGYNVWKRIQYVDNRHSNLHFVHTTALLDGIRSLDNDKRDLNLILVDHYDSFTYNLYDIISQYCIQPPTVVTADSATTWDDLQALLHRLNSHHSQPIDGIILSPGPGHPNDAMSLLSHDCIKRNCDTPILGVCLGHQILGSVYGATIDFAPEPVHGQVRGIRLLKNTNALDPLWDDINIDPIQVTRYHSLAVTRLNSTNLIPTAVSDDTDSVVMAMRHKSYPHFGVQFHPESIGTNVTGMKLLKNFVDICWRQRQSSFDRKQYHISNQSNESVQSLPKKVPYKVYIHKVPRLPPNGANMRPTDVMTNILSGDKYSYWLDDASADANPNRPTVSILGSSQSRVEYWGKDKAVQGLYVWDSDNDLVYRNHSMSIMSYLYDKHQLNSEEATLITFEESGNIGFVNQNESDLVNSIPFSFRGGHVGYLGYEVRYDTTQYQTHMEGSIRQSISLPSTHSHSNSTIPSAAFLWADKSFVYDHQTHEWYLVGVVSNIGIKNETKAQYHEQQELLSWMQSMSILLQNGINVRSGYSSDEAWTLPPFSSKPIGPFRPKRSEECYYQNFQQCMDYIRKGESYELCLTNQFENHITRSSKTTPLGLYNILRRRNPAPYAAFLHWNPEQSQRLVSKSTSSSSVPSGSFAICCSSPERFLSVKSKYSKINTNQTLDSTVLQWEVEAKPIKGTIARVRPSLSPSKPCTNTRSNQNRYTKDEQDQDDQLVQQLYTSIKDRAENLMIVDLLRNDMSQVCEVGSVHVSNLMNIESYTTVHQMVSTIRGILLRNKNNNHKHMNAIDVLNACFPGGSMTGAPKVRTMELLHILEDSIPRGPYSGCLGYISCNGCMDMNIVIRTAIVTPDVSNDNDSIDTWKISIGAGGAITALSQPKDEYNEMILKASAIMGAVSEWANHIEDIEHHNDDNSKIQYDHSMNDTTKYYNIKNGNYNFNTNVTCRFNTSVIVQ